MELHKLRILVLQLSPTALNMDKDCNTTLFLRPPSRVLEALLLVEIFQFIAAASTETEIEKGMQWQSKVLR